MKTLATIIIVFILTSCGNPGSRSGGSVQSQTYATVTISDGPTYDFGPVLVGNTIEHQFTVTNEGKFSATQITSSFYLSQTFSYKGGTYPGTGGTCTTELGAGKTCLILVTFSPKSNQNSQAGLTLNYFDGLNHSETTGNTIKGTGIFSVSE